MSYLSCLNNNKRDLVVDASVLINLSASEAAEQILCALPHRLMVTDIVASELTIDQRHNRDDNACLETLIKSGTIELASMGMAEEKIFLPLVSGAGMHTLDDGEAATIAVAAGRRAGLVIDERKARRICQERYPDLLQSSTLDIFLHEDVRNKLGKAQISQAIYNALTKSRMRVRRDQKDAIVSLIGTARALNCNSIPNIQTIENIHQRNDGELF